MASRSIDLPAGEWVDLGSEDCTLQHRVGCPVYLVQDSSKPRSPISLADSKRAKVLTRNTLVNIVDIDGNLYGYCHRDTYLSID